MRPRDRRRTALLGLVIIGVGALLTFLSAASFDRRADRQQATILAARAREAVEVIQARVSRTFDAAIAVRSLIVLEEDVDPARFRQFTVDGGLLAAHPRAAAVSFARYVPSQQLSAYAETLAERGAEVSPPVQPGQDAVVVEHIAPLEVNREAFGFNLLSEDRRRVAIERARDLGVPTATAPIILVQDDQDEARPSILLVVPVYDGSQRPSTGPERRRAFLGAAVVVVRTDTLLAGVVGPSPIIDLEVFDIGAVGDEGQVGEPVALREVEGVRDQDTEDAAVAIDTSVGDRRWRLVVTPNDAFPAGDDAGRIARAAGAVLTLAVLGLVVTLATARQRAEALAETRTAELRHANESLIAASRAKSIFLSTVSHELRTPLTAVMGFVTLLRAHGETMEPEQRKDMLDRIDRNATGLHRLIEELLDFSQLDDARTLRMSRVDLGEVVGHALDSLTPVMGDVPVLRHLPGGVVLQADPQAIERIVSNLVTNAIKYGGPEMTTVAVEVIGEPSGAAIVVRDDGRGIPEHDHERIFGRFERGDGHTTIPGTGIGLAVVQELAARHGGEATVRSTPGGGTEFTVRLAPDQAAAPTDPEVT